MELTRPEASPQAFRADQRTWRLGPLAITWSSGDGVTNCRDRDGIRRDQLDHWIIILPRRGRLLYDDGERTVPVDSRSLFLTGLHVPNVTARTEAEWILVFVPRNALPEIAPAFDALIGRTLEGTLASLLRAHLDELAQQLPRMTIAESALAAKATLAMIRAAVTRSGDHFHAARPQIEAGQRGRALSMIRAHLGSVRFGPDRLAFLVGMSRSQLYRLFEADGGVARTIQKERLRAIHRALIDPAERRSIRSIAEALGIPDPSCFSRVFRQEFGMTASEVRSEAKGAIRALPASAALPPPARNLNALLHHLGR